MHQSYATPRPLPYPVHNPDSKLQTKLTQKPLTQLLLLTAVVALITLPNLAAQGLTSSEGHRVIPALEMLNSGDTLVTHMFEQPYLRKPQLVPWLFAAALSIHNNPDLTPRLVSAGAFLILCFSSFFFARNWFGPRAAFPAGLAAALTPLFWSPARAAEIESINNTLTALGAWITVSLLITTTKKFTSPHTLRSMLALCMTALLMLLAKGPAGFPIFLALIISASILNRSPKPLIKPTVLIPIALAAITFTYHWSRTLTAGGPAAITQSPSAFMFEAARVPKLIAFTPVALITALPITLALLFPWGRDAIKETENNPEQTALLTNQLHTARLLTLAIPLALLIMNITGVSNDRYAQPILATASPIVGWLLTINLLPHRKKILRILTLGSPKILAALLAIAALIHITILEPTARSTSGNPPAIKLATDAASYFNSPTTHHTLIADAMIEARPETLHYFKQSIQHPDTLTILWIPNLDPERIANAAQNSKAPLLALIRTDPAGDESDKLSVHNVIASGTVHEFDFALVTLNPPQN